MKKKKLFSENEKYALLKKISREELSEISGGIDPNGPISPYEHRPYDTPQIRITGYNPPGFVVTHRFPIPW